MKAKARGFSLIELLVVIFILAVGLTSVSALFVAGTISARKAQRISAGTNAALQQLERLHSAGFAGCIADAEIFTAENGYTVLEQNEDLTGRVGFAVPDLPDGQGVIDIAYYTSSTGVYPNLKDVTVTVTWTGGAGTGGTTHLQSLIANRPD